MAFKIFPKSPKAASAKLELAPVDVAGKPGKDGRNLADPATTISRHHGDTELGGWAPQAARIEVEEEGALGPSLENSALMFAHGNATAATAALVHALDTAERSQPMVWMCLFDLYARAANRAAFDEPLNRNLHMAVIPGFALHWDLGDLRTAMGERQVVWSDPTNWMRVVQNLPGDFQYRYLSEGDDRFLSELLR